MMRAAFIDQFAVVARLYERLEEQRGLRQVFVRLYASQRVCAPPRCDGELMDGIPLGSGNKDVHAFTEEKHRADRFMDQVIQEPEVFRRRAAQSGHGRRLARVFVRATIFYQEFHPVAFGILEGYRLGFVSLVGHWTEIRIDRLEDFQNGRKAVFDPGGNREILREIRVTSLQHGGRGELAFCPKSDKAVIEQLI